MAQGDTEDSQIPMDQEVCMWVYSDIPYLQQMTDSERIKNFITWYVLCKNWSQNN